MPREERSYPTGAAKFPTVQSAIVACLEQTNIKASLVSPYPAVDGYVKKEDNNKDGATQPSQI